MKTSGGVQRLVTVFSGVAGVTDALGARVAGRFLGAGGDVTVFVGTGGGRP
ncbi:MAG: hypothetical protein WAV00_12500 [Nocardioides sp.]